MMDAARELERLERIAAEERMKDLCKILQTVIRAPLEIRLLNK